MYEKLVTILAPRLPNAISQAVLAIVYIYHIYLSKVLTERFSILYKTQTKEDIRFYILTLV